LKAAGLLNLVRHPLSFPWIFKPDLKFLGRERQLWAREEYVDHSVEIPGTHWCSELNGYYDTDSEVEQNNINDDLIKMIEGDWN
jgi:hypothetical protein